MILYSCESCDFGIAGNEPDDAEDEYELRQDIEAHEEFHRREPVEAEPADAVPPMNFRCGLCGCTFSGSEAEVRQFMREHRCPHSVTPPDAVKDLFRDLAKKGAVILPERDTPVTRADVRAIVREEIARATEVTPEVLEAVAHAIFDTDLPAKYAHDLREWAGQMRGEEAERQVGPWPTWQDVPVVVRVTSKDSGRYDTLEKTSDGTTVHRFYSGTECCRSLNGDHFVGPFFVAPFVSAEVGEAR